MKAKFSIERASIGGVADSAVVMEGEDPIREILAAAWRDLGTDVYIKIGGVSMFASAWEDPEHWAEDWADKLGCERDDVSEAVAAIVAGVVEG